MNQVLAALRDAPHCSVSSIKTYLMCPAKYAHRYVYRTEATHRNVALVMGKSVHDALESFYRFCGEHGGSPPVELLTDTFSTSWRRGMVGDPPVKADDVGKDKDQGISLLQAFHEQAPRPLKVLAVEEAFAIPFHNPDTGECREELLVGAIDAMVVDEDGRVVLVESKTAKRRWAKDQLAYDFQPTIYQMAAREMDLAKHPAIRFDFMLKLKTPVFESTEIYRSPEQEVEALHVLHQVLRAVDAGIFYQVRGWMCGDCEFAHACSPES